MSFASSIPTNIVKFSYVVVTIPTYIYSCDTVSALETVSIRELGSFDYVSTTETPVKVVSDDSTLTDIYRSLTIPTTDATSITDTVRYMYKESRDGVTASDVIALKTMIQEELVKLQEYLKSMYLEGVTTEELQEYVSEASTIVEVNIQKIMSSFRYVKDGDSVLVDDFNEVLNFARETLKVILAIIKILLDERIDLPEELMKLVTDVTRTLR